MSFVFRPAVREKTSLLIGIAGSSGSGKTFSALKIATGLAGPSGRIGVIDTEAGRALHYADRFKFDHGDLTPPFTPARYTEAIAAAEEAGYDVIVVDSMSHEHEGVGGLQDWADELEAKGVKSPGNWRDPKRAHKRMVARLLQCRAHLIFCFRADEKIRIEKAEIDGRMKTVVVPLGWVPITEKRFMYELTVSMLMTPDQPGVPVPIKIQDQHRHCFPAGDRVGEATGSLLAEWAHGGTPPDRAALQAAARRAAADGREPLSAFWKKLGRPERALVNEIMDELRAAAEAADQAPGSGDAAGQAADEAGEDQAESAAATTAADLDAARASGAAARKQGRSRKSVPYPAGSAPAEAWLAGFDNFAPATTTAEGEL